MRTQKEAIKLAREALALASDWCPDWLHKKCEKAISALDEVKEPEPVGFWDGQYYKKMGMNCCKYPTLGRENIPLYTAPPREVK